MKHLKTFEEINFKDFKQKAHRYLFDNISDEQRETEELIEKTIALSYEDHIKGYLANGAHRENIEAGDFEHNLLVGLQTDMSRDLQEAMQGKTLLRNGREINYDHMICNEFVMDWLKKNKKGIYRRIK